MKYLVTLTPVFWAYYFFNIDNYGTKYSTRENEIDPNYLENLKAQQIQFENNCLTKVNSFFQKIDLNLPAAVETICTLFIELNCFQLEATVSVLEK